MIADVEFIKKFNVLVKELNIEYKNTDYSQTGLLNYFPKAVRDAIIPTTVVSGHGWFSTFSFLDTGDTENFVTTDKLYLLAPHEIWIDTYSDGMYIREKNRDTTYDNTRQLDYYEEMSTSTANYSPAIKQLNGRDYEWWLRTPGKREYYACEVAYNGSVGDSNNAYCFHYRILRQKRNLFFLIGPQKRPRIGILSNARSL